MDNPAFGKPFRVLALDGGGAKGFYTLGALKEIEGLVGCRLCERFDLIYGTSTGAIIAALLGLGKSVDDIEELYRTHVVAVMSRWLPRNKTGALEALAAQVFGELKFDAFKTDIGIVGTRWSEERPIIFKTNRRQAFLGRSTFEPGFGSGEPTRLSADAIRRLGADLRQRLLGYTARPFEPADLFRRAACLRVNGRPLRIVWDAANAVHDEAGAPVLGVCEHDPQEPATVMISLNGELLGDQPEMLRSTAAHELGHAIFDMPAAVAKGAARAFRSGAIAAWDAVPIDWREWRADEFMGAFLAPRRQLARSFAREASAFGAAIRWKVIDEIPMPYVAANVAVWPAIDAIAGALAEEFGVTSAFIGVRLRKYGLVG